MLTAMIIISIVLVLAFIWMARVLDAANQLPPPQLPQNHPDNQPTPRPIPAAQPVQRDLVMEFIPGRVYEVSFRKVDGTIRHYGRFLVVFSKPNGFVEGIVLDQQELVYFSEHKEAAVLVKQAGFMMKSVLAANCMGEFSPSQMAEISLMVKALNKAKSESRQTDAENLGIMLYDLVQLLDRD